MAVRRRRRPGTDRPPPPTTAGPGSDLHSAKPRGDAIAPHAQPVSHPETFDTGHADSLSRKAVEVILEQLDDDKAEDVVVIDLVGKTSIADSMIRGQRPLLPVRSGRWADHLPPRN